MYDHQRRAEMVLDARLRAFNIKLNDQLDQQWSSEQASLLSDADDVSLTRSLEALGMGLDGPSERNQ